MDELRVNLGERSYPILIGAGLIKRPELIVSRLQAATVIVTSERIG